MQEINNILRILNETKEAIKKENYSRIENLSNQTINTASFTQDPDNILVAVVVFSLSKIFEEWNYKKLPKYNTFYKLILTAIEHAIMDIDRENFDGFRKDFENINKEIEKISGKLKNYVQEVFRKAKINKASKIYAHGISMEQTAKLLGITMFEMAEYIGQTNIPEMWGSKTINAKMRIKFVTDIFK